MNHPEGRGESVIDLHLVRRERMFENVVFDPLETQRPRGIETERLDPSSALFC